VALWSGCRHPWPGSARQSTFCGPQRQTSTDSGRSSDRRTPGHDLGPAGAVTM
jgi:hypothetical protein